jgi:hypothetical protein
MGATIAAFNAVALLESLSGRGAEVSIKGSGAGAWLHVAPRGVLSNGERADFRQHQREIMEMLELPDAPTVAHRWESATTQPDARQLLAAVKAATRGAWLTPQPALLSQWKQFNAHFAANITSQQIGAIARLIDDNPQLDNDELLTQIGALVRMENQT